MTEHNNDAVEMPDDDGPVDIDEFVAFSPTHTFIHTLTGDSGAPRPLMRG